MRTKQLVVAGRQCGRRMWWLDRGQAPAPDAVTALMLRQGEEVLALARRSVTGKEDPGAAIEAAGVRVQPDLLTPGAGGGWRVTEVRASNDEESHHLDDLAVQWYVLGAAGLDVREAWLWHLNRDYVRGEGGIDPQGLFIRLDRTAQVRAREDEIAALLAAQSAALAGEEVPAVAPGPHCRTPYACEFFGRCNPAPALDHISRLPGLARTRRLELQRLGVERIPDIPDWFPLNALQKRARAAVESGAAWFSPDLATALAKLRYPLSFLDFETVSHAVPRLPGMRPWRYVPMQWSLHIERAPGSEPEHHEFLWAEAGDPRPRFVESLLKEVDASGTIVVFGKVFEDTRLKELAEAVPARAAALQALRARLWDLHPAVKQHTAHPAYRGSFSIKRVLPALAPELSYEGLEVGRGDAVQPVWERLVSGQGSGPERARWRQALLDYCRLDTLAMVRILERLRNPEQVRRAP